jgi:hypothetical protein
MEIWWHRRFGSARPLAPLGKSEVPWVFGIRTQVGSEGAACGGVGEIAALGEPKRKRLSATAHRGRAPKARKLRPTYSLPATHLGNGSSDRSQRWRRAGRRTQRRSQRSILCDLCVLCGKSDRRRRAQRSRPTFSLLRLNGFAIQLRLTGTVRPTYSLPAPRSFFSRPPLVPISVHQWFQSPGIDVPRRRGEEKRKVNRKERRDHKDRSSALHAFSVVKSVRRRRAQRSRPTFLCDLLRLSVPSVADRSSTQLRRRAEN